MKSIMWKWALIVLCLIFWGGIEETVADAGRESWPISPAQTTEKGRWETGLFQSLRYGYSETLEFETHPLLFFVMPNFSTKWMHWQWHAFQFTTRHQIIYPTWLLRILAREGTGGIISPEFDIPHMAAVYNEIIISKEILSHFMLSGTAGLEFSVKSGKLDSRTSIDLPLIYPRMQVYYHHYGFRAGIHLQAELYQSFWLESDGNFFISPPADEGLAFEHKMMLNWLKNSSWQFNLGYKLVYGEYLFGTQWHLFVPLIDVQYAW